MAEQNEFIKDGDVIYFEYQRPQIFLGKDEPTIYVWDIDKTYLNTKFETIKGLFKTAFEKAFQKTNVPGTPTLIKALQLHHHFPVFFISASPPQMESKIYQKMRLDGLSPAGIYFKDNLKNLRFSKFRRLKQHVGFKIQALMQLRIHMESKGKMILFGDDSESDAVVYSLFSDICSRRIPQNEILATLTAMNVEPEQRKRILQLQARVLESDPVHKIFINLVTDTDPDYYAKFGRRVLATYTTFQAALNLFEEGRIDTKAVLRVARDMISNYGFTPEELANNLDDIHKRGFFSKEGIHKILPELQQSVLLPSGFSPHIRASSEEGPWIPTEIDYLHDFR